MRRLPGRAARPAHHPDVQSSGDAAQPRAVACREDIAAETGLEHRSLTDGERVAGIYRRSVMLASGRYAMLNDGLGFSLVPWKPVIEQPLGKQVAATVRGSGMGNWTAAWAFPRLVRPTPAIL